MARLSGVNFQFVAQAIDVYLKHVTFTQVFRSPYMLQQHVLRHDPSSIVCQVRQDALLGWRQRYLVPGQGHHLLRVVHRQITPGDGGL